MEIKQVILENFSLILAFISFASIGTLVGVLIYKKESEQKAVLKGRESGLLSRIEELQKSIADKDEKIEQVVADKNQAEKEIAAVQQEKSYVEKQLQDFEKVKDEMLQSAKSSIMESANTISSKLLEDHKRETAEAKSQSEKITKQTTEELHKQFDTIAKSVASLSDDVLKTGTHINTVINALKTPAGAGVFGEVGLENTFKSFGLEPNIDFAMQHTVVSDGRTLRPDAVLFLPHDTVMVIDSKSSKFVIELAEAEGTDKEEELRNNLAKRMNEHLKDLASKNYKVGIEDAYKAAGKTNKIARIINVMYMPTDTALLQVKKADKDFMYNAQQKGIIPIGTAGLAGLIYLTKIEIGLSRQEENQQKIMDATRNLLESVSVVVGYASGVGRGIKSAADNYEKFTNSVNKRLLPRAKNIESLGVAPKKELPDNLASYNVITNEPSELIEIAKVD